jgi:hypothetical protein
MVKLSDNQKDRIANINMVVGSISFLGSVGGLMYANRTGGKFWRYVGYFIVGGMIVGVPARVVSLPFVNKIVKESSDDTSSTEDDSIENQPSLVETLQKEIDSKNKTN